MPKLSFNTIIKVTAAMALSLLVISSQQSFASEDSTNIFILGGSGTSHCAFVQHCFKPTNLTVKVGSTVQWHNRDSLVHMIASGSGLQTDYGSVFDSKVIVPGQSFLYQFTKAGIYDYFCEIHPWMTGEITVMATASGNES